MAEPSAFQGLADLVRTLSWVQRVGLSSFVCGAILSLVFQVKAKRYIRSDSPWRRWVIHMFMPMNPTLYGSEFFYYRALSLAAAAVGFIVGAILVAIG